MDTRTVLTLVMLAAIVAAALLGGMNDGGWILG